MTSVSSEPLSDPSPYLLLVADDLMMPSRVREAVKPQGMRVQVVASAAAAVAAAESETPPRAVLVNLTARRYDPAEVIRAVKASPARALPVLAFAGHVEQEKHQLAREAGADLVAANSSVALHLPALLSRLLNAGADTPLPTEEATGSGG